MKATLCFVLIVLAAILLLMLNLKILTFFEYSNIWTFLLIAIIFASAAFLYQPHFTYLFFKKPLSTDSEKFVSDIDLTVLEQVVEIFNDQDVWDRNDDRYCLISDKKSLFCAIALTQKKLCGKYAHWGVVSQEVRFVLENHFPERLYKHPIMDFNNHQDTTLDELHRVLHLTINRLKKRVKTQNTCQLK